MILSASVHLGLAGWNWSARPSSSVNQGAPLEITLATLQVTDRGGVLPQPVKKGPRVEKQVANTAAAAPMRKDRFEQEDALQAKRTVAISPGPAVKKPRTNEKNVPDVSQIDKADHATSSLKLVDVSSREPINDTNDSDESIDQYPSVSSVPKVNDITENARPRYRDNPLPEYPVQARRRHWEGEVWLRVHVSATGNVEAVELEKTSGYPVLDRSAERTVHEWKFVPARRAGMPVSCRVRVPVQFQLDQT